MKSSFSNKFTQSSSVKMASIAMASIGLLSACGPTVKNPKIQVSEKVDSNPQKPNFVTILTDDQGYSDLSCFGGEIDTPNICALAEHGVMVTDYYTAPVSAPTRAMLLTGTDNHLNGLGNMPPLHSANQIGVPGYEGHLTRSVLTVAEILNQAGYNSYFAGKWHVGSLPASFPSSRGFDHAFAFTGGGVSHWNDQLPLSAFEAPGFFYVEDGKKVDKLPADFYSSKAYTDKIIEYIGDNPQKPFFAELAFTAPHDPLHAPDEWIEKYMGRYEKGYDVLRKERLARMKKMGLVAESVEDVINNPDYKPWDSLTPEQQRRSAKSMAVYAAMISYLDHEVGRLVQHLKDIGEFDNTYFIYTHDNGSNPKGAPSYGGNTPKFLAQFDNSYENMGRPNSFVSTGAGWAEACSTPFAFYKTTVGEGGVRAPLIFAGPGVKNQGKYVSSGGSMVTDVTPTIIDLAGAQQQETRYGVNIHQMTGKSLKPFFLGTSDQARTAQDAIAMEFNGERLFVKDNWKIRRLMGAHKRIAKGQWELFNLADDPSEQHNLAEQYPEKLKELTSLYDEYAQRVGVVEKDWTYPSTYLLKTWSLRDGKFSENPYENIYHKKQ